jgi:hypothetical protein
MYVANTEGHIRVIFQTDHDQLLIGSLPSVEQAMSWRTNPDAALLADLASDSTTGSADRRENPGWSGPRHAEGTVLLPKRRRERVDARG